MTHENHNISTTRVPMVTKLVRLVTYLNISYLLSDIDLENTWSHEITWQIKNILSALPQCLSPPICRIVDYLETLLVIKSHVPLITQSCEVTWQTKIKISPLTQNLWPPNLTGWWLILRGSYKVTWLLSYVAFWDHVTN